MRVLFRSFPERELEKYKSQRMTAINNAKTEPMAVARQELARHFNHWPADDIRYVPTFAEAIEATESLERQQLVDFHERFYGLGNIRFAATGDRKRTRLNSSHVAISYAVF